MSQDAGIYARESSLLDRSVQFGEAQGRVISLSFPSTPDPEASDEHDLLDRIDAYLEGSRETFGDVTVALTVPTDRRTVLEQVRAVPYGTAVTCAELAGMSAGLDADDEAALELVRRALADNPAPLLIPDHRVRDAPSAPPTDVAQRLRSLEGLS